MGFTLSLANATPTGPWTPCFDTPAGCTVSLQVEDVEDVEVIEATSTRYLNYLPSITSTASTTVSYLASR